MHASLFFLLTSTAHPQQANQPFSSCDGLKEEACASPSSNGECFFLVDIQTCLPRCDSLDSTRCQLEPMCQILSETGNCTSQCFAISPLPERTGALTSYQWLAAVQRDSIACSLCNTPQSCTILNQLATNIKANTPTSQFPLRTDDNPVNMNCQWTTLPDANQITSSPSQWNQHVCIDHRLPSSNAIGVNLLDSTKIVHDIQDAQKNYQSKDLNSLCYLEPIDHGSYQPNKKVLAPSESVQLHCDEGYFLVNNLGGTVECSVEVKGQLSKGRSSVCIPSKYFNHKEIQRHQ
eukprot:Protomagalhaensia_sp_Gyna_25__2058@NODE_2103_length_1291_cov_175_602236_g1739_i0_p1_GENE_NODE_2103_length_1291_cov_175_602236_g1739_i0NODE_2103_length_1291_cov_175_602236_g1739_i0_p1_ORF_typecomplete_len311_score45_70Sushi/PF00084_20/0_00013_NODE_2103_length_1291_cov_175_602236_g1739_i061933